MSTKSSQHSIGRARGVAWRAGKGLIVSRRVLWVGDRNDHLHTFASIVAHDIHIDHADTLDEGLTLVVTTQQVYALIVITVDLSRACRLTGSERLRSASTLVLLLLGREDFWTAVLTTRGMTLDRTTALTRAEVPAVIARALRQIEPGSARSPRRAWEDALEQVRRALDRLADAARIDAMASSGTPALHLRRLCTLLATALVIPELPLEEFLAAARALKHALGSPSASPAELARASRDCLTHADVLRSTDVRLQVLLVQLESSVHAHTRVSEQALADTIARHPSHLGRMLRLHTGLGFREWRSVLAMRVGVVSILERDVQVAQIAYSLGFDHPSQFTREFRQLFGSSPRALRKLYRASVNRVSLDCT